MESRRRGPTLRSLFCGSVKMMSLVRSEDRLNLVRSEDRLNLVRSDDLSLVRSEDHLLGAGFSLQSSSSFSSSPLLSLKFD